MKNQTKLAPYQVHYLVCFTVSCIGNETVKQYKGAERSGLRKAVLNGLFHVSSLQISKEHTFHEGYIVRARS